MAKMLVLATAGETGPATFGDRLVVEAFAGAARERGLGDVMQIVNGWAWPQCERALKGVEEGDAVLLLGGSCYDAKFAPVAHADEWAAECPAPIFAWGGAQMDMRHHHGLHILCEHLEAAWTRWPSDAPRLLRKRYRHPHHACAFARPGRAGDVAVARRDTWRLPREARLPRAERRDNVLVLYRRLAAWGWDDMQDVLQTALKCLDHQEGPGRTHVVGLRHGDYAHMYAVKQPWIDVVSPGLDYEGTLELLQQARVIVTQRLHAALVGLYARTPTLILEANWEKQQGLQAMGLHVLPSTCENLHGSVALALEHQYQHETVGALTSYAKVSKDTLDNLLDALDGALGV